MGPPAWWVGGVGGVDVVGEFGGWGFGGFVIGGLLGRGVLGVWGRRPCEVLTE